MSVLNATEIMGQDIARRCVERVIILGCVVAVPFLRRRTGQGQKITQRCVVARAGAFPRQQVNQRISGSGVSENARAGSLGFWVNLFKSVTQRP